MKDVDELLVRAGFTVTLASHPIMKTLVESFN